MARKPKTPLSVEALKHEEATRKNIPTAEYQSVMAKEQQTPLRVAYERRNRDLDPQLVWRGKDEQDWSDLVVHAPPLYIQEKIHPKVLIDDLRRFSPSPLAGEGRGEGAQIDLFSDFNGLPENADKTDFYQHDAHWSNRMILGDSLQVMASLAEREGLRGQVQCIYFDPPYGIKFNSNFQWSTTSRDVKDGNAEHITREPEQVKAFRDTWRDGIHSYLTYLRDRLTVARDLLTDSGSIFVQIGDENVHRVRAVMDEVFGEMNFCSLIAVQKTSGSTTTTLPTTHDYIVFYAKRIESIKFRKLYEETTAGESGAKEYKRVELDDGQVLPVSGFVDAGKLTLPEGAKLLTTDSIVSKGGDDADIEVFARGRKFVLSCKPNRHWKTQADGIKRLWKIGRLLQQSGLRIYKRYFNDFPYRELSHVWNDTRGEDDPAYVVQTHTKVVERCLLMATDPGDLVLDPTCGSGTTAHVAEQWGRRWITIDTSRVALALARVRVMGARYTYYLLADSAEGQLKEAEITRTAPSTRTTRGSVRQGFVCERLPHITLKSIANNAEIDVIWDKFQQKLEPLRLALNAALGRGAPSPQPSPTRGEGEMRAWQEWEIPREADAKWPEAVRKLHAQWWEQRIARQKEIDASIAAKADSEYLYDKPYEDKKRVRVAGPFTVESLSPHRVLGVDDNDELIDPADKVAEPGAEYVSGGSKPRDFVSIILENLKTAGVQQKDKADKITFTSLVPWPGDLVCAEGKYQEGTAEKRAAIFIGPEFGTVARPDLVEAAKEAADAGFDVLIACAFNYDAHASEFAKLGRIPILKARMNADLHMAEDLKNTGKGNLFVIFGEPDVNIWEGGSQLLNDELQRCRDRIPETEVRIEQLKSEISEKRTSASKAKDEAAATLKEAIRKLEDEVAAKQRQLTRDRKFVELGPEIPKQMLSLEVRGVDVFDPSTGEVRSDSADGIACWFIDTDYNEESFFVRHAYFLGAADPYKSLKTTLKAEINEDAWATLNSDTSRPFPKPKSGRIAVKVINHLGDEVMKVFKTA